jgi:AbrB family looped-hinge helix DNA binding protein
MNAHTRLSAKGQVVIPKAVRDRLNWSEGEVLEAVETAGGVLLRRKSPPRERITVDEFLKRVPPYEGPPVTLEEMKQTIPREAAARFRRKVARPPE